MANWDGGQVSTLTSGNTLTCTTLSAGQLYGIFLYNSAGNDNNATVDVLMGNATQPVQVTVPGTTAGEGLASLVFLSGSDNSTVSVSMVNQGNAQITCFLGSVSMPTNTAGITNQPLPENGSSNPFGFFDRYFAVPPSTWSAVTIVSNITQFISVQFQEDFAQVNIVNPLVHPTQNIFAVGSVAKNPAQFYTVQTAANPASSLSYNIQGDGTQWVWINADSPQDSSGTTISLQQLSIQAGLRKIA
jgi:hypothetical protein